MAMKKAAAEALASVARDTVPAYIRTMYALPGLAFGPDYIVPKPFDRRLFSVVSHAVARAAVDSGVARQPQVLPDHTRLLQERLTTLPDWAVPPA